MQAVARYVLQDIAFGWRSGSESPERVAAAREELARREAADRARAAASIRASVERDSWNAVGMRAEIGECGYPTRPAA